MILSPNLESRAVSASPTHAQINSGTTGKTSSRPSYNRAALGKGNYSNPSCGGVCHCRFADRASELITHLLSLFLTRRQNQPASFGNKSCKMLPRSATVRWPSPCVVYQMTDRGRENLSDESRREGVCESQYWIAARRSGERGWDLQGCGEMASGHESNQQTARRYCATVRLSGTDLRRDQMQTFGVDLCLLI